MLAFVDRAARMIVIEGGRILIQGIMRRYADLVHMSVLGSPGIALGIDMHMQTAELRDEQPETSEDQQVGPETAHGAEYIETTPTGRQRLALHPTNRGVAPGDLHRRIHIWMCVSFMDMSRTSQRRTSRGRPFGTTRPRLARASPAR